MARLDSLVTPIWDEDMGRRLASYRMHTLRTQEEFARFLGLTQRQLSDLETGRCRVNPKVTLDRLRAAAGNRTAWILTGAGEPMPSETVKRYWASKMEKRAAKPWTDEAVHRSQLGDERYEALMKAPKKRGKTS